jgi:hypothetical protein
LERKKVRVMDSAGAGVLLLIGGVAEVLALLNRRSRAETIEAA